jgi:hypothetical protein
LTNLTTVIPPLMGEARREWRLEVCIYLRTYYNQSIQSCVFTITEQEEDMLAWLFGLVLAPVREAQVNEPKAKARELLPPFRTDPDRHSVDDLPDDHPMWAVTDTYRQWAWVNGITRGELDQMYHGGCLSQQDLMVEAIQQWLRAQGIDSTPPSLRNPAAA